jgi:hypothetical protein
VPYIRDDNKLGLSSLLASSKYLKAIQENWLPFLKKLGIFLFRADHGLSKLERPNLETGTLDL